MDKSYSFEFSDFRGGQTYKHGKVVDVALPLVKILEADKEMIINCASVALISVRQHD